MCLGQQTMFDSKKQHKKFKGFDLWKLLCQYSGREFDAEKCTPVCMRIHTSDGEKDYQGGFCFAG